MERVPVDMSGARVLLTNDDGIEAHGFSILESSLKGEVGELWVSAPSEGHSGASAMVSLRREIEIEARGERRFAVTGRPADTVLAALRITMAENPPTLVLSGINHGANIGGDLVFSGTVGAAAVACLNGIPAIALSADHAPGEPVADETWIEIAAILPGLIQKICSWGFIPGSFYSVNFPEQILDIDPVLCRQGDIGDTMYYQSDNTTLGGPEGPYILLHGGNAKGEIVGTDYGAVRAGRIGITPVTLDRTDHGLLRALAEAL